QTPSCFTPFTPYTPTTVLPRSSQVRNLAAPQLALAMGKKVSLRESVALMFKAEAFNLTNTPLFGGPSTANPNQAIVRVPTISPDQPGAYTGYGTIGSQQ